MNAEVLISNIDKIHTTELGFVRIRKNLGLEESVDIVAFCKELVSSSDCEIRKNGKNWYCRKGDVELTVNSYNYCVITGKKSSRKN